MLFWFWGLISVVSGEFIALINDVPWISSVKNVIANMNMNEYNFIPAKQGAWYLAISVQGSQVLKEAGL